jgi:Rrf2 family protein
MPLLMRFGQPRSHAQLSVESLLGGMIFAPLRNLMPASPGAFLGSFPARTCTLAEVSMKLTNACRYAIHAIAFMAAQDSTRHIPSYQVAKAQGVPERFLLKVLRGLVDAQVVHSIKGPHGGYRLTKPPQKLTLLEIVEAVDGPIRGEMSFTDVPGAGRLESRLQAVCDNAAATVRQQLGKIHLADLL